MAAVRWASGQNERDRFVHAFDLLYPDQEIAKQASEKLFLTM